MKETWWFEHILAPCAYVDRGRCYRHGFLVFNVLHHSHRQFLRFGKIPPHPSITILSSNLQHETPQIGPKPRKSFSPTRLQLRVWALSRNPNVLLLAIRRVRRIRPRSWMVDCWMWWNFRFNAGATWSWHLQHTQRLRLDHFVSWLDWNGKSEIHISWGHLWWGWITEYDIFQSCVCFCSFFESILLDKQIWRDTHAAWILSKLKCSLLTINPLGSLSQWKVPTFISSRFFHLLCSGRTTFTLEISPKLKAFAAVDRDSIDRMSSNAC